MGPVVFCYNFLCYGTHGLNTSTKMRTHRSESSNLASPSGIGSWKREFGGGKFDFRSARLLTALLDLMIVMVGLRTAAGDWDPLLQNKSPSFPRFRQFTIQYSNITPTAPGHQYLTSFDESLGAEASWHSVQGKTKCEVHQSTWLVGGARGAIAG